MIKYTFDTYLKEYHRKGVYQGTIKTQNFEAWRLAQPPEEIQYIAEKYGADICNLSDHEYCYECGDFIRPVDRNESGLCTDCN